MIPNSHHDYQLRKLIQHEHDTTDIPGIATGYVPYTGASADVNLGIYGLSANSIYCSATVYQYTFNGSGGMGKLSFNGATSTYSFLTFSPPSTYGTANLVVGTLGAGAITGTSLAASAQPTTLITNLNADLLDGLHDTSFVKKADTHSLTFVLDTPVAADVFPMKQFPYAVTITKVTGTVLAGTSFTFNIEERSATGLNSAGTDVITSELAADQNGESTTTFSNAGIAANAFLVLAGSGLSGVVKQITVMVEYTIN
jgi:hypothetical protein